MGWVVPRSMIFYDAKVFSYREISGANKNRRECAGQTADEPHVFVSVGFCLSGIRIAGSPRAGSR
ncbi:hypothetical protein, partial [Burkholderia pseudomallei]|uniref:hypothetical protein n=1 Tax=Burkholderia pseudomallei TaxID=28450 RepID=UPI001C800127